MKKEKVAHLRNSKTAKTWARAAAKPDAADGSESSAPVEGIREKGAGGGGGMEARLPEDMAPKLADGGAGAAAGA